VLKVVTMRDGAGPTWTFSDLLHAALTDARLDLPSFARRHDLEIEAVKDVLDGEDVPPDIVIRLLDALDWQPTSVIVELHGLPAIPRLKESRPARLRVRRPKAQKVCGLRLLDTKGEA